MQRVCAIGQQQRGPRSCFCKEQSGNFRIHQELCLSSASCGLFLDGLHHHLQVSVPDAGIKIQHTRLTDMEYADDVFLLAHCPSHLQALITALADYCQQLHTQVSIAKTKVMIIGDGTQAAFTCQNQPLEQVESFKYLGLPFHQSGHMSHLITPKLNKAAASWQLCSKSTHSCNVVTLFV